MLLRAISEIDEDYLDEYEKIEETRQKTAQSTNKGVSRIKEFFDRRWPVIAACAAVVLLVIICKTPIMTITKNIGLPDDVSEDQAPETEVRISDNVIFVNPVSSSAAAKLAAEGKNITVNELPERFRYLAGVGQSVGLEVTSITDLYVDGDHKAPLVFDTIRDHTLNFEPADGHKFLRIAVSTVGAPLRCELYNPNSDRKSVIGGVEMTVFWGSTAYYATFEIDGTYFDVESNRMSIEEVVSVLEEIVAGEKAGK